HESQRINLNSLWVLLLGIIIGLIIGSVSFMIYCIISKKKQPITEKKTSIASTSSSSKLLTPEQMQPSKLDRKHKNESKSKLSTQSSSSDSATNNLLELTPYSSTSGSSEWTTVTSSLSYQPDIIL
ncbi:unnamed protein product, partial [Rotaria magnacalcarata]